MYDKFHNKLAEYEDEPEKRLLYGLNERERQKNYIREHSGNMPQLADEWEEELKKQDEIVIPFAEKQFQREMTPEIQEYLLKKAVRREAFLRVRSAIADKLDEEGLELFNQAMEKELG